MIVPFSSIDSLKIYHDIFAQTISYIWNQDLYLWSDYYDFCPLLLFLL